MLAVNGKVCGYCVHLPVCNLQTVKSTEKVSRLRESTYWEKLLPSTCAFEMKFSLSRCPPSTKSGVGVYKVRGSSFLTSSWPSWWSWTLPPSFPAMSTSWGWFLPFTVSHFDLPGPRYAVAKAKNGNFGDGSRTVWLSVKMVKTFFPIDSSSRWLGDGQKTIYILYTLGKVMGVQSSTY